MLRFFGIIGLFFFVTSCDNNTVFTEFKSVPNAKWHKENPMEFTFNVTDTLSENDIFIHLRNDKNYDFNNVFLIVKTSYPNTIKMVDTLEYEMADKNGYYLGEGFTDIKESKLSFKDRVVFPTKGDYTFSITQAMRKNGKANGVIELNGISDVGISIEKIK